MIISKSLMGYSIWDKELEQFDYDILIDQCGVFFKCVDGWGCEGGGGAESGGIDASRYEVRLTNKERKDNA